MDITHQPVVEYHKQQNVGESSAICSTIDIQHLADPNSDVIPKIRLDEVRARDTEYPSGGVLGEFCPWSGM